MTFRFNHVGITVSDLERAVEFYRMVFGLEPGMIVHITQDESKAAALGLPPHRQRVALLPVDDLFVELIEFDPTRRPFDGRQDDVGYAYISFSVDDLDATYDRLQAAGLEFNSPPIASSPDGPTAGAKFCILKDPDGKNVELVQFPSTLQPLALHARAKAGEATFDDPLVLGH